MTDIEASLAHPMVPRAGRWDFSSASRELESSLHRPSSEPATLWRTNRDRIDPSWSLTLADFSPGMIDAARRELGERAVYVVADAQELPFPADSFGAVLANHMLYHVPDRPRAFTEIRRVLVSGGTFHASTIGRGHLAELDALVPGQDLGRHAEAFGLETGPEQLQPFFADVRIERFEDGLAVTDAEPVLAYIRSSSHYHGEDLTGARKTVQEAIARHGAFTITKRQGVISCRKPQLWPHCRTLAQASDYASRWMTKRG